MKRSIVWTTAGIAAIGLADDNAAKAGTDDSGHRTDDSGHGSNDG